MPYLIDGNNLAHALGLSNEGLADRDSCARMVVSFCRTRGAQATIVFDGPARAGSLASLPTPQMRIVFSQQRSADEVILRILSESSTPRDFTVVTSDKSLGDRARHRGATVERTHEFSRRLDQGKHPSFKAAGKPSQKESPEQIQAWLAVFDPSRKIV